MSSEDQFTAKGPAIIAFQTNALEPIQRGVDVEGDVLGVRGSCTGGPGVVGRSEHDFGIRGESQQSVGVFGEGPIGVEGEGSSGPGVKGTGGIGFFFAEPGVVGHGSRRPDDDNAERLPHGPGIVGVGGGKKDLRGVKAQIGSVGVFGAGADTATTEIGGIVRGPLFPGAGVVGVGGTGKPHDDAPMSHAPGVVGVSGSAASGFSMFREPGSLGNVGVFGGGAIGVKGRGSYGAGVEGHGSGGAVNVLGSSNVLRPGVVGFGGARQEYGGRAPVESAAGVVGVATGIGAPTPIGDGAGVYGIGATGLKGVGVSGRGGVFQSSSRAAQLGLTPVLGPSLPQEVSYAPEVADDPPAQGLKLPGNAMRGDLMAVSEGHGRCRLWFCVQGNGGRGAQWAEVLLGPQFDGVGR